MDIKQADAAYEGQPRMHYNGQAFASGLFQAPAGVWRSPHPFAVTIAAQRNYESEPA